MALITDSHFENDEENEYDLRLKMRDRSNLPKFLNWFIKGENREVDPWREFYEELIKTEILPHNVFEHIQYELIGRHVQRLTYSEHSKIEEFKLADIYCLKYVNAKQEEALKTLAKSCHPNLIWVTEEEIKKGHSIDGKIITEHTPKIFHTKIVK